MSLESILADQRARDCQRVSKDLEYFTLLLDLLSDSIENDTSFSETFTDEAWPIIRALAGAHLSELLIDAIEETP